MRNTQEVLVLYAVETVIIIFDKSFWEEGSLLCVENTEKRILKFFPTERSSDTNILEPLFSEHHYRIAFASGCLKVVIVHTEGYYCATETRGCLISPPIKEKFCITSQDFYQYPWSIGSILKPPYKIRNKELLRIKHHFTYLLRMVKRMSL